MILFVRLDPDDQLFLHEMLDTKGNPRMNMVISAARVISAMTNTTMPQKEEKEEKVKWRGAQRRYLPAAYRRAGQTHPENPKA